jgi:dTDP-4-dehydro-6-deoxy-alpha-D-glucopyranose 2,3-dehydratase
MTSLLPDRDPRTPMRIATSMHLAGHWSDELARVRQWFAMCGRPTHAQVRRVGLDSLDGWYTDPDTGNIHHHAGKFFSISGLAVSVPGGPVEQWHQPIILQPEIGILGILVKERRGVLQCLMQAKIEPGNENGLQLSPTVQATRSNYTRVHGGKPVPYLEYFTDTSAGEVIVDVRQSEQGSWFHQKRNRNMVVEVTGDIEVLPGFRWMTLGEVHRLLAVDDLVNMDARTVLSCLPFAGLDLERVHRPGSNGLHAALIRSCSEEAGSLHSMSGILSWITERRTRTEITTTMVPLSSIRGWQRGPARIWHESGLFFDVMGVDVTTGGREIGHWTQPMLEPHGTGVVAFLVRDIAGVLHVLVRARVEPGFVDVIELAPTVQCTPENYNCLPPAARPPYLDEVLRAGPQHTRFATVLSEEGGRFFHARNSYRIVETDLDPHDEPADFRWLTVHQLIELLRHSHYVNVQARTMIACLHGMVAGLVG